MKTLYVGAACAALLLCGAVAHGQGKNSPTCGPDKVVTVEVHGSPTDVSYALAADSTTLYGGNSKENVRLQIDNCTFDLVMNFSTSRRRVLAYIRDGGDTAVPLTLLNFDRVASVPVTAGLTWDEARGKFGRWVDGEFVESPFCNNGLSSNPLPPSSQPQDNYAGCGVDDFNEVYVRRTLTAQVEGREDRRVVMQKSPLDGHAKTYCVGADNPEPCEVSYVRVYRPDASTWMLSPEPKWVVGQTTGATPMATELVFSSSGVHQAQGKHELPFRITVRMP
jgi:hypothetical protein